MGKMIDYSFATVFRFTKDFVIFLKDTSSSSLTESRRFNIDPARDILFEISSCRKKIFISVNEMRSRKQIKFNVKDSFYYVNMMVNLFKYLLSEYPFEYIRIFAKRLNLFNQDSLVQVHRFFHETIEKEIQIHLQL